MAHALSVKPHSYDWEGGLVEPAQHPRENNLESRVAPVLLVHSEIQLEHMGSSQNRWQVAQAKWNYKQDSIIMQW